MEYPLTPADIPGETPPDATEFAGPTPRGLNPGLLEILRVLLPCLPGVHLCSHPLAEWQKEAHLRCSPCNRRSSNPPRKRLGTRARSGQEKKEFLRVGLGR